MNLGDLISSASADRIDKGHGAVNEHSIEFGDTVLVFKNIGSFSLQEGQRSNLPIVGGAFIAFVGLVAAFAGAVGNGLVLTVVGLAILGWGLTRKPDNLLQIGTSDGRRTNLVSKDRDFLLKVLRLLRSKIDDNMLTASINVTAGTIESGVAIGPSAKAAGAFGTISSAA